MKRHFRLRVLKRENEKITLAYSRFHEADSKKIKGTLIFERINMLGSGTFFMWKLMFSDIPIVEDFEVIFKIKPLRLFSILNNLYSSKDSYSYNYNYSYETRYPDKASR